MIGRRARRARPRDWAVVTGASSGIGAAMAGELASRGHRLRLVARRKDRLEKLARDLRRSHGVEVEIRVCDLSDRVDRAALCEELAELEIGVLANNAGFTTCGNLAENDPVREVQEVEVNVVAIHDLTLAVLPGMLARNTGTILVTGSTAGLQPVPSAATYAASKAFVNTFAQALHGELRGTGVTCTLLAPGPVSTEFMTVGGFSELERQRWFVWRTPQAIAKAGLRAAERNRRITIPGPMAKMQALAGRYLPHDLTFLLLRTIILPRRRSPYQRGTATGGNRMIFPRRGTFGGSVRSRPEMLGLRRQRRTGPP